MFKTCVCHIVQKFGRARNPGISGIIGIIKMSENRINRIKCHQIPIIIHQSAEGRVNDFFFSDFGNAFFRQTGNFKNRVVARLPDSCFYNHFILHDVLLLFF